MTNNLFSESSCWVIHFILQFVAYSWNSCNSYLTSYPLFEIHTLIPLSSFSIHPFTPSISCCLTRFYQFSMVFIRKTYRQRNLHALFPLCGCERQQSEVGCLFSPFSSPFFFFFTSRKLFSGVSRLTGYGNPGGAPVWKLMNSERDGGRKMRQLCIIIGLVELLFLYHWSFILRIATDIKKKRKKNQINVHSLSGWCVVQPNLTLWGLDA